MNYYRIIHVDKDEGPDLAFYYNWEIRKPYSQNTALDEEQITYLKLKFKSIIVVPIQNKVIYRSYEV